MTTVVLWAGWTALVWGLWLDCGWFGRSLDVLPHALDLLPPWPHAGAAALAAVLGIAGASATAILTTAAGGSVLRWLGWRRHRSRTRPLIAAGAGIPAVALAAQAAGLDGLFYPALLAIPPVLVAFRRARAAHGPGARRPVGPRRAAVRAPRLLSPALALCAGIVALAACAPEVAWDASVYHMRAPEAWMIGHRVRPPWGIPHSFFPFNGEMLMTIASSIGGHRAAKFLHTIAWGGCALLVARLGTAWAGPAAGPWAAAVFMSAPLGMVIASRAYIEFFMTLPLLGAAWLVGRRSRPAAPAAIAVAGWLAGAAMGAKFPAAIPAVVLGIAAVFRSRRRPATASLYGTMAAASCIGWGVRTWLWTGNLVYPAFLGGLRFTPEDLAGLEADAAAHAGHWAALVGLPMKLLGKGENDGGWGPVLLATLALPLLWRAARRIAGWTWAAALGGLWWFTPQVLRFLFPGFAFASAAAGAALVSPGPSRRLAVWLRGFVVVGTGTTLLAGLTEIWQATEPFGAAFGKWSDREYVMRRMNPEGWMEMGDLLASKMPASRRAYIMGHPFALGLPFRAWTDLPYLRPHLFWLLRGTTDPERIAIRARQAGLCYIAHNPVGAKLIYADRPAGMSWTPATLAAWNSFGRRYTRLEETIGPWRILRIDRTPSVHRAGRTPTPGTEGAGPPHEN